MRKTTKQLLFIGITLALSSCTMVKRTYMPGWYVERINSKHAPAKNESDEAAIAQGEKKQQTEKMLMQENAVSAQEGEPEEKITADAGNQNIVLITPAHTTVSGSETITLATQKQKLKHIVSVFHKKDKHGWFATIILGLILIAIGWVFLVYVETVGVILYYIFGIAGVIFIILGIGQLIFG